MTPLAALRRQSAERRRAQFRYGAVFFLVLALLLFEVVAPSKSWARAIDVALAGTALGVAVATGRERVAVRRTRTQAVGIFALVVIIGIGSGLFGPAVAFAAVTILVASIPVAIGGGLVRLIRRTGVTIQVVAGALTVYLVVGLLFASVISFAATVESGQYFKQGPRVSNGERVYYSFTVLTTTGFGDYTAAQPFGHALAVLEMLTGQLYLVTVIGVVVGNFAAGRPAREPSEHREET
jgi:hypothetical protein